MSVFCVCKRPSVTVTSMVVLSYVMYWKMFFFNGYSCVFDAIFVAVHIEPGDSVFRLLDILRSQGLKDTFVTNS